MSFLPVKSKRTELAHEKTYYIMASIEKHVLPNIHFWYP